MKYFLVIMGIITAVVIALNSFAYDEGGAGFALIPAQQAAQMEQFGNTLEARSIIRSADSAVARMPNPLAVLHVEGTLPHQGIYDASLASAKDLSTIRDLAMAWQLTKNNAYLEACNRYYAAWLHTYTLSFNPIDETRFDDFIIAYDFIRDQVPPDTRTRMERFLRTMAEGYLQHSATGKSTAVNNWQSHRIKLMALAAFALADQQLINRVEHAFQRQLDANLQPDGSTYDFKERDALHYVVYDLEPLVVAALAASAHGMDWYHKKSNDGVSLADALTWLTPYAEGRETHAEFVHSTVRFDAVRNDAGVQGFSGQWEPKASASLYHLAAHLDTRWAGLAKRLGKAHPWMALAFSP